MSVALVRRAAGAESMARRCGVALVAALCCAAASAQTISVVPNANPVLPGSPVSVSVLIDGVADLYAWQLGLSFDASLLQATGQSAGGFLSSGGTTIFVPGTVDNTLGTISFATETLIGLIPGVSGGGMLLSVGFDTLAQGTAAIRLNPADTLLLNSTLGTIQTQLVDGSVTIVPEPSAALLLALGVAGLALRRRIAAAG